MGDAAGSRERAPCRRPCGTGETVRRQPRPRVQRSLPRAAADAEAARKLQPLSRLDGASGGRPLLGCDLARSAPVRDRREPACRVPDRRLVRQPSSRHSRRLARAARPRADAPGGGTLGAFPLGPAARRSRFRRRQHHHDRPAAGRLVPALAAGSSAAARGHDAVVRHGCVRLARDRRAGGDRHAMVARERRARRDRHALRHVGRDAAGRAVRRGAGARSLAAAGARGRQLRRAARPGRPARERRARRRAHLHDHTVRTGADTVRRGLAAARSRDQGGGVRSARCPVARLDNICSVPFGRGIREFCRGGWSCHPADACDLHHDRGRRTTAPVGRGRLLSGVPDQSRHGHATMERRPRRACRDHAAGAHRC